MNTSAARGAAALSSSWADAAWRRVLDRLSPAGEAGRLSILIFHRVTPEPDPLFPTDLDRAAFDALCARVAAWYHVLPLSEAVERLQSGSLPSRALSITFDDGYADNHDIAMPVLRAHGLTATFFIATGFLDGGRMWNDTVVEALRGCTHPELDLSGLGLEGIGRLELSSMAARGSAMHRILGAAKYLPPAQRLDTVARIAERADVELPDDLMMTSAQVRAMAEAGMEIGAHTLHHPILARLDDAAAHAEIAGSKHVLEALLGRPVTLFAYPNGKPDQDYRARDAEIVRRLGFRAAVSTAPGAARRDGMNAFQLPRFTPWDLERKRFALRLARNLFTPAALAREN